MWFISKWLCFLTILAAASSPLAAKKPAIMAVKPLLRMGLADAGSGNLLARRELEQVFAAKLSQTGRDRSVSFHVLNSSPRKHSVKKLELQDRHVADKGVKNALNIPVDKAISGRSLFGRQQWVCEIPTWVRCSKELDRCCPPGHDCCSKELDRCCPPGQDCCSNNDYCAFPGEVCCPTGGTCRQGMTCCNGFCMNERSKCCSDGESACKPGAQCCHDGCILAEEVCCSDGGYCGEGEECCNGKCMPKGAVCCSNGSHCSAGQECCPGGESCREPGGTCCEPGGTCCGDTACSSNEKCCQGRGCVPKDADCCKNGRYCENGLGCCAEASGWCCPHDLTNCCPYKDESSQIFCWRSERTCPSCGIGQKACPNSDYSSTTCCDAGNACCVPTNPRHSMYNKPFCADRSTCGDCYEADHYRCSFFDGCCPKEYSCCILDGEPVCVLGSSCKVTNEVTVTVTVPDAGITRTQTRIPTSVSDEFELEVDKTSTVGPSVTESTVRPSVAEPSGSTMIQSLSVIQITTRSRSAEGTIEHIPTYAIACFASLTLLIFYNIF
ncbi:hypothetical protein BDZ91DRAFT_740468 [Kalaharituber pfeilii]|nr:hypothetical protein BDZ91DRAFT_740468 [Kalaharituber pfeilii]